MPDYAERVMKVRIPIDNKIDWLKELEDFRKKYGQNLDPDLSTDNFTSGSVNKCTSMRIS